MYYYLVVVKILYNLLISKPEFLTWPVILLTFTRCHHHTSLLHQVLPKILQKHFLRRRHHLNISRVQLHLQALQDVLVLRLQFVRWDDLSGEAC